MSLSLHPLIRNLRLRIEGKPNPITAFEELRATLTQEQKRRAEAELEACTLRRRLSAYENHRPRDAKGRYAQKSGGTTCKRYQPQLNA